MSNSGGLSLSGPRSGLRVLAISMGMAVAAPALAQTNTAPPIALDLPIRCQPGVDCWIANYVDVDPSPAAKDFNCGPRSYQAHKGTDFALRDLSAVNAGVEVLAAAAGTVVGTRDGVKDLGEAGLDQANVENRECGNGVRIGHDGGWFTQYCHLRRGTVVVKRGDAIAAGDVLGLVGLSGRTVFPHLHFGLSRNGKPVDPFRGERPVAACGLGERPSWKPATLAKLPYRGAAIYNIGFATEIPKSAAVREGRYKEGSLSSRSAALVLWVDMFGVRSGDQLTMRLYAPDGSVFFNRSRKIERTLARAYEAAGRRRPGRAFPPGRYRGEALIQRETAAGPEQFRAEAHVNIR